MSIIKDLEIALAVHKAKMEMVEKVANSATEEMQLLLIMDLESTDKTLETWITAAPVNALIHQNDK